MIVDVDRIMSYLVVEVGCGLCVFFWWGCEEGEVKSFWSIVWLKWINIRKNDCYEDGWIKILNSYFEILRRIFVELECFNLVNNLLV